MPLTGEVILVRARSTRACASPAWRWATVASALLIWASATPSWACAAFSASDMLSTRARALSASLWAMNCLSTSIFLRSWSRMASARSTLARETRCRAGRGIGPGGEHGSVRGVHIGLRLANAVLESLGVDQGDHLAGLDL